MNRDKQIEEMATLIYRETDLYNVDTAFDIATTLHDANYRKASDVAREIFEEIGELINEYLAGRSYRHEFLTKIAELKKKYTEGER